VARHIGVASRLIIRLLGVAVGVVIVAWIWRLAMEWIGPNLTWILVQVPLGACTATLAWQVAARHERLWVAPVCRLEKLIEDIRESLIPIDSLSEITGPVAPLARQVQKLLRELRREEQENSRQRAELSQKHRRNTEALEGKLNVVQTQAQRDALTGLLNRRQLDEQLPKLMERCGTKNLSLSVLMLDLDHFKLLNDAQGHAAGDKILRDVGQLIRSSLRDEDQAYRLGGDEFLILLPDAGPLVAQRLAGRLTALVDQLASTVHMEKKLGISAGMICLDDLKGLRACDVLERADDAMYEVKSSRKAAR